MRWSRRGDGQPSPRTPNCHPTKQLLVAMDWIWLWVLLTLPFSQANGPPRIRNSPPEEVVRPGDTVLLPCSFEGDSSTMVEWYKDRQPISEGWDERYKINRNKGLRIRDVEKEDEGHYQCKVVNGFGVAETSVSLLVLDDTDDTDNNERSQLAEIHHLNEGSHSEGSKPVLMSVTKRVLQRPLDSSIRLKCMATGNPRPEIIWLKNGGELALATKNPWSLHLQKLKLADSGHYTCLARNNFGSVNATFVLEVIDRSHRKPELTGEHPVNTTVKSGGTASFQCHVRSDLAPHVKWLKRIDSHEYIVPPNNSIKSGNFYFRVLKSSNVVSKNDGTYLNKLILSPVQQEDSGMYICLGANAMGYSVKSAFLTVIPEIPRHHIHDQAKEGGTEIPYLLVIVIVVVVILLLSISVFFMVRCWRRSPSHESSLPQKHIHPSPRDKLIASNGQSIHHVHGPPSHTSESQESHSSVALAHHYPHRYQHPRTHIINYSC